MSLWCDKNRPKTLSNLDYHKDQADQLKKLVHSDDFPHLLVYGPNGAGKKTRIMCALRELYGPGVEKLRIERQQFETPSKKTIEMTTLASNYHIEINPSDAGIYDRIVIQELIKNIAQANQLDVHSQKSFKVVLLTEVDRLTKDAQHALRRTMEKYMATCRLILSCNSTSRVIPAVRSRCLALRVASPTHEQIATILKQTCKIEGASLPNELATRIAQKSSRNLRRALLMLETAYVARYPFTADQDISEPDWELFVKETARLIVQQQSAERVLQIRDRLYELLCHCIPPDVIFKGLLKELIQACDQQLKPDVVYMAADLEHRMNLGDKPIFYLEAFVVKFMALYKKYLENSLAGCI